jgi:hypothetical protein
VPAKAEGAEGADTAVPRKEEPETAPDGWCDDGKGGACDDASASWDDDPVVDLEMRTGGDDDAPDAWWVSLMNEGLDTAPGWTLLAFFICDLGSALVLFAMYTAASVNVDADFVLAYALAKGPLRAPRLALDAIVAADMTRRWPQLARVKVTALIDAGTDALAAFKRFVNEKTGRGSPESNAVASSANKNGQVPDGQVRTRVHGRQEPHRTGHHGHLLRGVKGGSGRAEFAGDGVGSERERGGGGGRGSRGGASVSLVVHQHGVVPVGGAGRRCTRAGVG